MKKNLVILLTLGILICLTATVVADNSDNNIASVRQHPDKPNVWQVASFEKQKISEYILQNKINLSEWRLTEKKVVEKAFRSTEKIVKIKKQKESLVSVGWFSFYQPIRILVVEKINKIISVKIITEKEDTAVDPYPIKWTR